MLSHASMDLEVNQDAGSDVDEKRRDYQVLG
jgi:hypothetical protein